MTMATIENLLSQGGVERLGWMLIHFVWQATVVALLLAGALRLLRRRSANARYVAGCFALAVTVALPVATVAFVAVPDFEALPERERVDREPADLDVEPDDRRALAVCLGCAAAVAGGVAEAGGGEAGSVGAAAWVAGALAVLGDAALRLGAGGAGLAVVVGAALAEVEGAAPLPGEEADETDDEPVSRSIQGSEPVRL